MAVESINIPGKLRQLREFHNNQLARVFSEINSENTPVNIFRAASVLNKAMENERKMMLIFISDVLKSHESLAGEWKKRVTREFPGSSAEKLAKSIDGSKRPIENWCKLLASISQEYGKRNLHEQNTHFDKIINSSNGSKADGQAAINGLRNTFKLWTDILTLSIQVWPPEDY